MELSYRSIFYDDAELFREVYIGNLLTIYRKGYIVIKYHFIIGKCMDFSFEFFGLLFCIGLAHDNHTLYLFLITPFFIV